MRYLLFLLLIPTIALTQKVNEFWVTPVANIEFSDTIIVYSYSLDQCSYVDKIHPVYYDPAILEMKGVFNTGCLEDGFNDLHSQVYGYLNEWNYGKACTKDKYNFLKATSLLIIWNTNKKDFLPDNTLEILGYLENDMSIEISRDTELVLDLYYFYNKK